MEETIAQKLAEKFSNDGTCWYNDEDESLEELAHNLAYKTQISDDKNGVKWIFEDDSVITAFGGAWDFGYLDCWCWQMTYENEKDHVHWMS
jgi:hypothetical protein